MILCRNSGGQVRGPQTNNVAEFEAATEAIQRAKNLGVSKLYVNTDSEFVMNCMTKWYRGWQRNGWETSRGPVKNRLQIEELLEAMQDMQIEWVSTNLEKFLNNPCNFLCCRFGYQLTAELKKMKKPTDWQTPPLAHKIL